MRHCIALLTSQLLLDYHNHVLEECLQLLLAVCLRLQASIQCTVRYCDLATTVVCSTPAKQVQVQVPPAQDGQMAVAINLRCDQVEVCIILCLDNAAATYIYCAADTY